VTAKAAFLPRIYVRASTGRVDGAHIQTGWQAGAGLHLDVPLYTGGLLSGELRAAEAEVAATVADAQIILDVISLEVNRAFRSEVAPASASSSPGPRSSRRGKSAPGPGQIRQWRRHPDGHRGRRGRPDRSRQRFNSAIYTYLAGLARLDYAMGRQQRPRGSP